MAAKTSKTQKVKPGRQRTKISEAKKAQTIAELRQLLDARNRDLEESLQRESSALKKLQDRDQQLAESLRRENAALKELQDCKNQLAESSKQQAATSEILGVIASSPTDIQPVLNVIAENAARICGTPDVSICRVEDDVYRFVATYGPAPNLLAGTTRPIDRDSVIGRSIVDCQTRRIQDVRTVQEDFWRVKAGAVSQGLRTMLATPLLREGVAIGAIGIRRTEVQPFTDKQIALLKTFADQAVIAIENVRLFQELKESLEQQTATGEILGVIASSPTDIQPVLDTIAKNAARVCGASHSGITMQVGPDLLRKVAGYGSIPGSPIGAETPVNRNYTQGRAFRSSNDSYP